MGRELVLVAAMLLGVGCAADPAGPDPSPSPASSPAAEVTDDPVADGGGGTLVAAISGDPGSLNPAITTSGGVHTASELMFNGLVELSPDGEPVPSLAASWDVEDDGALYRFHLVEGVTWHDGEPFTADDVVYTFEEALTKLHARTAASVGNAAPTITAVDDLTVEFRFDAPYAPLLQQLNVTEAPILPRHVYGDSDLAEHPANLAPVGTGPFRFVSYTPDSEIRVARNEDYFKPGLPVLDEVVLRIVPDESSALAALERGEVDFLFGAPGPELERLRADGGYGFLQTATNPGGSNCIMTVTFNLEDELFQDVRTRRGIAHAIDREQIVERILFGQGRVARAPFSSGIPFAHDPDSGVPEFDPAEADRLLTEAGWVRDGDGVRVASGVEGVADGTELAFEFLSFPTFAQYGELLRSQLADVGIELSLRALEPPVFIETVFTERDFDTNVISYCNGPDPEIGIRRMYDSSNIGPIPFSNAAAYSDPEVDAGFEEGLRTVDPAQRGEVYSRVQRILTEDLPYLWLVETESVRVFTAACRDFGEAGHFAETAVCDR
ncbi:MAG: ABC transporter substrate-binding protein [Actinomycetes bacterium]